MTWKFLDDEDPVADGFYVVWRQADEGEDFPPAEWDGVEEWSAGAWPQGDWGITMWWDEVFPDAAAASAAAKRIPDP